MKSFLNILKKIILGFASLVVLLLLIVFLFFQVPAVQNYFADKALKIAGNKLDTEIDLESIIIIPPNSIKLKEIYLEGAGGDTLFYSEELSINLALFKLVRKEIELNRLRIGSTRVNLIRSGPDSTFNFPGIKNSAEKEKPAKEESDIGWTFDMDRIILDQVDFLFSDENLGNQYTAHVGNLKLKMSSLNPQIPEIGIHSVKLSESQVELKIQTPGTKNKETESKIPDIWLNRDIEIKNVDFLMNNFTGGQKIAVHNINLLLKSDEINLPEKKISLARITLEETKLLMIPPETDSNETMNQTKNKGQFDWDFSVAELNLKDNHVNFRTEKDPATSPGFDPKNIQIQKLSGDLTSIKFSPDTILADINSFHFSESNQFRLENFSSYIFATSDKAELKNFSLSTPFSRIRLNMKAKEYNLHNIKNTWKEIFVDLNLQESHAGMEDIRFFYPDFSAKAYGDIVNELVFKTEMHGKISDISLKNFRANVNKEIILKLHGDITGFPDLNEVDGTFFIDSIFLEGNNARRYFPDTLIPEQLYIPKNFLAEGVARGNTKLSRSRIDISSAAGNIHANLRLNTDSLSEKEFYQANILTESLDLGMILQKPDTLGKVFMNANLKGFTQNFKDPRADLRLEVDSFNFIRYPYSNFHFNGHIAGNSVKGTAGMDDENIRFSFNGEVDASDSIPDMDFTLNLIGANLKALNIAEEDIRVGAALSSSLSGSNLDNLNGKITFNDLIIVKNNEIHELDSLLVEAKNLKNRTELKVLSSILQARYEGTVKPSDISSRLWSHINLFFAFRKSETEIPEIAGNFSFEGHIDNHPLISGVILPELQSFQGIDVQVDYNEENNKLSANTIISPIHYKNIIMDSLKINLNSEDTLLQVEIDSKGFRQDLLNIPGISSEARLANDLAKWTFSIKDEQKEEKYNISGTLNNDGKFITANFDSAKLMLNYETWNLPADHSIRISDDSTIFNNLTLTSESQVLSLSRKTSGPGIEGAKIEFTAFELETFSNLITTENLVEAEISGKIVFDPENGTRFISDLQITDLATYGEEIFNMITIKAEQTEKDKISFMGQLEDQEERIKLQGFYLIQPENQVDLDINVSQLKVQSFQPLLSDVFETLSGTFNADLNLSGPFDQLEVNGDLEFAGGEITPRMLGTTFKAENIQLNLKNNNLAFKNFSILDADGNQASVNGSVEKLFSESPVMNIKVMGDNFTVVDVREGENDLFFGKLGMDISTNINGDLSEPDISGAITITNNTDFHFIVPSPEKATIEQEGLVVFIEPEKDTMSILYSGLEQEKTRVNSNGNLDITATVEIQEEALIEIVIDPASGENL
ncbi:MAG: translocation/assembly module TamB domain-containing protein, partial [Bacteroidota bacterium]